MNLTRRNFFAFCSKDLLRDTFSAWQNLQSEMHKEATKITCEEAAFKLGRKAERRRSKAAMIRQEKKKVILNSKGGKN